MLTAVDYEKNEMYSQMQGALRKFYGGQMLSANVHADSDEKEEAYATNTESEVLYTHHGQGWIRGRGGYFRRGRGYRRSSGWGRGTRFSQMNEIEPRQNRQDSSGNTMRCFTCESTMHFKKDCPHAKKPAQSATGEQAMRVKDYSEEDKQVFMCEAVNSAVLDSACTKTVTGQAWLDTYLDSDHYPLQKAAKSKGIQGVLISSLAVKQP